jgi:phosphoribosyl 1,2-cyclic phosphodiesterase
MPLDNANIEITFLGVRGSTPCAGTNYQIYGGHTSCVMARIKNKIMIFDAGSGIVDANSVILSEGITEVDLFFSHVHLDHIMGLPFFTPVWKKDIKLNIYAGSLAPYGGIHNFLSQTFNPPLFPIPFANFPGQIVCHDFLPGTDIKLDDHIILNTCFLNHPNGAVGYRVNYNNKSMCYVTDTEHSEQGIDQNIQKLITNADLLIYDSTFDNASYLKYKGWGHSTWEEGCVLANAANVKQVAIFHHDPSNDDVKMSVLEEIVKDQDAKAIISKQGMKIIIS